MDIEQTLIELAMKYPNTILIFTLIGVFRATFKPVMYVVEVYVKATPKQSDDEKLAKFKESKFYKSLSFVVDYLLSIKIPQIPTKKEEPPAEKK